MKERIRCIMEYVQLSQQDFATKLNISPASLSSIFTGRTNPTNNHVMAIHKAFPDVNISWLMFGEGNMFATAQPDSTKSSMSLDSDTYDNNKMYKDTLNKNSVNAEDAELDVNTNLPKQRLVDSSPIDNDYSLSKKIPNSSSMRNSMEMMMRAKMLERRERKIKEIRVFYDDGTYEAFIPSNK